MEEEMTCDKCGFRGIIRYDSMNLELGCVWCPECGKEINLYEIQKALNF